MTYIKGFNAIRAFSVLLVVLTHLDLSEWIPNTDFVMMRVWPMMSGEFGVLMFFVLSGFLITKILLHEKDKFGFISLKKFYIRRFLRLFPPLILFFILLGIAYWNGLMQDAVLSIGYGIFYVYNFVPKSLYFPEMGHLWSLGVEEQFYILWPFVLTIFKKITTVKWIVYGTVVISGFLTFWFAHSLLSQNYFTERWFIPASIPILIGCLAAILHHTQPQLTLKISSTKWAFVLMVLCFSFTLYVPSELVRIGFLFRAIAVALLLLYIVHNQHKKWMCILEWKPLVYVGTISYGIYIYQGFFLRTGGGSEIWFQKYPLNIILAVLLAILSYELIEKPILQFKKKFETK
jgi:peptidoglycan/LPS O-acetylase OafA/YrhL